MPEFKKISTQGLFTQYQTSLRQFDRDLLTLLDDVFTNVGNLLNRGLTIDDNFDEAVFSYTSNAAPDTEDAVSHDLGRIPTGFIVTDINKGGVVYRSGTAFTATQIFLKCSTGSTAVKVLVF